jgi:hypothetical protein
MMFYTEVSMDVMALIRKVTCSSIVFNIVFL